MNKKKFLRYFRKLITENYKRKKKILIEKVLNHYLQQLLLKIKLIFVYN